MGDASIERTADTAARVANVQDYADQEVDAQRPGMDPDASSGSSYDEEEGESEQVSGARGGGSVPERSDGQSLQVDSAARSPNGSEQFRLSNMIGSKDIAGSDEANMRDRSKAAPAGG